MMKGSLLGELQQLAVRLSHIRHDLTMLGNSEEQNKKQIDHANSLAFEGYQTVMFMITDHAQQVQQVE